MGEGRGVAEIERVFVPFWGEWDRQVKVNVAYKREETKCTDIYFGLSSKQKIEGLYVFIILLKGCMCLLFY